mgnify:CR=1 FL=1
MINITFPDGTIKKMKPGITSLEIAMKISEGLARNVLSATVNDKVWDLNRPIYEDCKIKLNSWSDAEGKSCFWHSSAHLLAEALEFFYPGIQFGIGPSIETGFYYDIDLNGHSISSDDFEKIVDVLVLSLLLVNSIVVLDMMSLGTSLLSTIVAISKPL